MVAADEGNTIKVRVSFTDDAGNGETLTSSATAEATYNSAATGAPRVVGVGRVGNTLTVDTFRIADANGLVNVFYSYQWISNDGSSDTDIEGATGSSYTLVAADGGNKIKVRVSFTDDAGYDETLTSAAFGRVTSIRPTGSVSSITVVVTEDTSDPNNVMTNFVVTWTGDHVCPTDYNAYLNIVGGVDPSGPGAKRTQYHLGSATSGGTEIAKELSGIEGLISYSLNVDLYCGTDAAGQYLRAVSMFWSENRPLPSTYSTEPPLSGLSVNDGTLSPSFDENEFDYNVPDVANDVTRTTITATPKTGYFVKYYESSERGWRGSAMLSPGPSIVDHPSGLSPDCKRRTTDDLGPMPELTDADPNTPGFQVDLYDRVNYVSLFVYPTDYCHYGSGYDLAITRAEGSVSLVRPNRPPTGSIAIEPSYTTHGPCNGCILSAVDYSINDRDGLTDATYSYQWLADDAEIAGATDTSYTVVATDEGKAIKVRVSFTDDAGNDESLTSSATAAAVSNLAITGTARVGNTLTADTSGIVDADGLVNVSYSYQWIANDGSSDTDIEGATGSSYTVSTADRGKTIKVRVSFTDDAGNDETRTSYPTRVVNLLFGYITGTVTEDSSDPNNVITNFTFTWVDAHVCSTDYNAYLHIVGDAGEVVHLGSATSSGAGITKGLAAVRDNLYWYRVDLYCGTDVAGRWVSRVYIPWSENRPLPGTYSSEPPLSGLSVSHGTLSPSFGSYWFSYNVPDVANDVTRTTITATPKTDYFRQVL